MGVRKRPTELRKLRRDARKAFRAAEHHQFLADAFLALGRELSRKVKRLEGGA